LDGNGAQRKRALVGKQGRIWLALTLTPRHGRNISGQWLALFNEEC